MFLQRIPFQHHPSQTRTTSRRRASRLVSSTWQYLTILLAGFLAFIFPSAVQGASLTVCANGCQYSTIGAAANELKFPALRRTTITGGRRHHGTTNGQERIVPAGSPSAHGQPGSRYGQRKRG